MSTIPSPIPSYAEIEQAVEQAYQIGRSTISCPAPTEPHAQALPSFKTPKVPSKLGKYEAFLNV